MKKQKGRAVALPFCFASGYVFYVRCEGGF